MKIGVTLLVLALSIPTLGQLVPEGWQILDDVKFETRYVEEVDGEYFFPVVNEDLKKMIGETVVIKGYYIPVEMDGNAIIISKYPYTSCFFCGGAGPESVAAVKVNGRIGEYYLDELITVRGQFAVNDSDVDMLNFIIEDAKILDE